MGRGEIELDNDVRSYLPEDFRTALQYETEITMLNLMNHNAGFGMFF
ncbi:serine hydrolase [Salinicoccus albus]|nr:serine hydrolase [Salinicoccus albus]